MLAKPKLRNGCHSLDLPLALIKLGMTFDEDNEFRQSFFYTKKGLLQMHFSNESNSISLSLISSIFYAYDALSIVLEASAICFPINADCVAWGGKQASFQRGGGQLSATKLKTAGGGMV